MQAVMFFLFAAILLAGAIGVVASRNTVHSALFLVQALFAVAMLFVMLQAEFLAAVQVIVYAGAIVSLFLFVIMILGVDRTDSIIGVGWRTLIAGAAIGVVVAAQVILLVGKSWSTGAHRQADVAAVGSPTLEQANVERLAESLFTDFWWPFEVTSLLLVVAVVAGVVLTRRPGPTADEVENRAETTAETEVDSPATVGSST